ncbi:ABC transporter substrate-binding protein [Microbacteriaceae bacterium K1510]|nr:ABC transporter substrate-binding protein [Microbacteriaceae bacterium K1510]
MTLRFLTSVAAVLSLIAPPAFAADGVKKIDMITMTDTPQLVEVHDGIVEGLKKLGYEEGKNIHIDFKSAQGNFGTAQQIVRQFVGDNPDVIVPITTPPSQASAAATKEIPIVFTTVTDPIAAKIVTKLDRPGGNASGVIDPVPVKQMLAMIKDFVPNLKTLGLIYDPSLPNSVVTVKLFKDAADKMGIKTIDSAAMGLNNVQAAGQALIGKVDAAFVPNDTTVYAVFESLVKAAQDGKMPLFTAERRSVQRGAIATIGLDFRAMGIETAGMIDKVLKGAKPGDLDVIDMADRPEALQLYINKGAAEKMGVTVSPELLKKAAGVF